MDIHGLVCCSLILQIGAHKVIIMHTNKPCAEGQGSLLGPRDPLYVQWKTQESVSYIQPEKCCRCLFTIGGLTNYAYLAMSMHNEHRAVFYTPSTLVLNQLTCTDVAAPPPRGVGVYKYSQNLVFQFKYTVHIQNALQSECSVNFIGLFPSVSLSGCSRLVMWLGVLSEYRSNSFLAVDQYTCGFFTYREKSYTGMTYSPGL